MTASVSPVSARTMEFLGQWDCQSATFTFTALSYDKGAEPMPIIDIATLGDTYQLTFEDLGQAFLAMNPDGSMTWYSPVTGDSFLCMPLN